MSFPPPPGLSQTSRPDSAQAQQQQHHSSLPPRPPVAPSSGGSYGSAPGSGIATPTAGQNAAFAAFPLRAVAANQPFRSNSPPGVSAASAPAVGGFSSPLPPTTASATTSAAGYSGGYYQYNNSQQAQHHASQFQQQQQQQYGQNYYGQQNAPQIRNPFPAPRQVNPSHGNFSYGTAGGRGRHNDHGLDPETEAQIAQWQSAYTNKEAEPNQGPATGGKATPAGRREGPQSATGANVGPLGGSSATSTPPPGGQQQMGSGTAGQPSGAAADPAGSGKTVVRSGGGQTWTDSTLLEWDPAHFRLFAGNLAGEVTDDTLLKAFAKYPSVQKARVIRDKRTEKSKGYGFVSFSDGDDYFRAAREMQGKYIGSHPVLLRRAMTEIRPVSVKSGNKGNKKGGGHAGGGGAGGGGKGGKGGGGGSRTAEGGVQKKQGKTKGGLRVLG